MKRFEEVEHHCPKCLGRWDPPVFHYPKFESDAPHGWLVWNCKCGFWTESLPADAPTDG